MKRSSTLKQIPMFDCLNPHELDELDDLFREISFPKGETVCREGEKGDSFFVIVSGELEVWGGAEERRVTNRLGSGDFFGEITLLLGGTRTATVTVAREARLLELDRQHFETFLMHKPKFLEYMAKVIAQRLASVSRGQAAKRTTTVISVAGPPGVKGKTLAASVLAGLLEAFCQKPALHVKFHLSREETASYKKPDRLSGIAACSSESIRKGIMRPSKGPAIMDIGIDGVTELGKAMESLNRLLETLKDAFSYLVLDLCAEPEALVSSATEISDFLIRLEGPGSSNRKENTDGTARHFSLLNHFNQGTRTVPINHMEPFVMPVEPALDGMDPAAQACYIREHPRLPIARPLHRLARKILGTTVGLALGAGAAFGIAHIGVIKVLEENDIPIDLVAGTSMGSIVAVGCATGMSGSEMMGVSKRLGSWRNVLSLLDLTVSRPGLLKGNQLIRVLAPLRSKGVETFEQLQVPCRTVAADIENGERVSMQSGRLDAAFRASSSVPMVLSPVFHQGRVLVDGGIVDPVPAEVVREMGADICIAVSVFPPLEKGVLTFLSRLYRKANRLNPLSYLSREKDLPNLFDIIMNSLQALQYELGNFKAISADVRIHPDLSGCTWMEFYKPMQFIEKGAEAAEQALPEIRRLISDRLSGRGPA